MQLSNAQIALVTHAANKALSEIFGEKTDEFAALAPKRQEGIIDGVKRAIAGETPEQLHESWCESMRAQGYKYGKVKDAKAKTHPCLLPYATLPEKQKLKDKLFQAIVKAIAPNIKKEKS